MTKTEHKIDELEEIFDKYFVPFEVFEFHTNDKGKTLRGILDKKSRNIYLEKYDNLIDDNVVYMVEAPIIWRVDALTTEEVYITIEDDKVVVSDHIPHTDES